MTAIKRKTLVILKRTKYFDFTYTDKDLKLNKGLGEKVHILDKDFNSKHSPEKGLFLDAP